MLCHLTGLLPTRQIQSGLHGFEEQLACFDRFLPKFVLNEFRDYLRCGWPVSSGRSQYPVLVSAAFVLPHTRLATAELSFDIACDGFLQHP